MIFQYLIAERENIQIHICIFKTTAVQKNLYNTVNKQSSLNLDVVYDVYFEDNEFFLQNFVY